MHDTRLYIVATPIGNLGDISQRARDVLNSADIIAAEDTRVTKKLFSLLGLSLQKKFIVYEDHSENDKFQEIIDFINQGKVVALVSDAGSPLISDPGYKLVRECRKQSIKISVIPGACAVVCALQLSGLPTNRFMFAGFVPNKEKARIDLFSELKAINTTLVLYETANKIEKTLSALEKIIPNREIAIVREITKMYEECLSGTASVLISRIKENPLKGELVLVIEPPHEVDNTDIDLAEIIQDELKNHTLKEAVKIISDKYNLKRNDVYEKALEIKNKNL
jgi:16S rRNA (cytidine1402-2'-O)-methyltransferase